MKSGKGDLENKGLAGYAVTQIITNIHKLKKKLTDEALLKLPKFDKIRLAGARNIASHDYDRVNFEMVYDFCKMLLSNKIKSELSEVLNDMPGEIMATPATSISFMTTTHRPMTQPINFFPLLKIFWTA